MSVANGNSAIIMRIPFPVRHVLLNLALLAEAGLGDIDDVAISPGGFRLRFYYFAVPVFHPQAA
jgi:hypothetical protein